MSATVQITLIEDAQDALAGFPFASNVQWIDFGIEEENIIEIRLADADDTNAQQEQFLNTNDQVVKYSIIKH